MINKLLLFLLLVSALILVACQSKDGSVEVVETGTAANRPDHEVTITPTLLPAAASPLPSPYSPNQTPQTLIPGEVITGQNQTSVDRCGILLPLTSPPAEQEDFSYNKNIALDIIPSKALPALERLMEAPESVGLVAYQIGNEEQGVYHNADLPMPLASVVKLVNLIAYAEAAAEGILNPADWIPLEELNRYYLPGTDLGSHNRALAELEERGLIGRDPPSIPLEEVPRMMIRHSSNAASDFIHLILGQEKIESTAIQLGLSRQTAPCSWIGQFLVMNNHERPSNSDRAAVQEMIDDPEKYGQEVMRLTRLFTDDPDFRQEELNQRWRSDINTQRLFSHNLNAQGSPQEYADLMSQIMGNGLSSSYVNILTRRALEWPMELAENQEYFDIVGYKNGSLPGILTTVYFVQRREDGAQLVLALFYRDLPMNVYRNWRQSLTHDEFARWLLIEPSAMQSLNQLLEGMKE